MIRETRVSECCYVAADPGAASGQIVLPPGVFSIVGSIGQAGTLITAAHVPVPLCGPSLASILSGRLPHQDGIYANFLDRPGIGNDRTKLEGRKASCHKS